MKKVTSIVLNNFKNDNRVLKENISLQKAGYEVQVVALHEEPLAEFEKIKNLSVHRIKLYTRSWSKHKIVQLLKYFEFIYKVVKKYKNSSIIHCNDLNSLPIGVIIKKFFNRDVKIVYDAHEYGINDIPNESKYKIKIKYILEKFLIKYADKVITVSDSIANEYVKLYGIEKPALVLNTPPYNKIQKKNIFRETLGIKENQTIFLYQGGLSNGRGIEILLDAFKSIDNENTVIVFMGYGELEGLIQEISKEHRNIYCHQAVSPDVLLVYKDGYLVWHYFPSDYYKGWSVEDNISINTPSRNPSEDKLFEDLSHAGLNLKFILEFQKRFDDAVFSPVDIKKLDKTIEHFTYNNTFSRFMSGDIEYQKSEYRFLPSYGWSELNNTILNTFYYSLNPMIYPDFDSQNWIKYLNLLEKTSLSSNLKVKKTTFGLDYRVIGETEEEFEVHEIKEVVEKL